MPDAETAPQRVPRYRRRRRAFIAVLSALGLAGAIGLGVFAAQALFGLRNVFGTTTWAQMRPELSGVLGQDVLVRPVGVAVTERKVYVTDAALGGVTLFTRRTGAFERLIGADRLEVPTYCVVDDYADRLYVTDRALSAVLTFRLSGSFVETLTVSASASADDTATPVVPLGVSVGDEGSLLLTDVGSEQRVVAVDPDEPGAGRVIAPLTDDETLAFPNAVRLSHDGYWISDSNNRRLIGIDAAGKVFRQYRTERLARGFDIVEPQADIGLERRFLVVDAMGHEVIVLDDEGVETFRLGEQGTAEGQLSFPNDVAVAPDGAVYVADTGNARVQSWTWTSTHVPAAPDSVPMWVWVCAVLAATPAGLFALLRPVRVVVTPDVLAAIGREEHGFEAKRRIRLLVTPASMAAAEVALSGQEGDRADDTPGQAGQTGTLDIREAEVSTADVNAMMESASFDRGRAEALALASRIRVVATEDTLLAEAARQRGYDVFDTCGFLQEFGRPGTVLACN